jgi:alpha-L-fucosidase
MKIKKYITIILIGKIIIAGAANAQNEPLHVPDSARMSWFTNAKFGIFLHWGVFSAGKAGASWPFFGGGIAQEDYMAQSDKFIAQNYDPQKWAEILKASGAKYAVLTAMHCDGVTLWPTKTSSSTIQHLTVYQSDLIGPYCRAIRDAGLKVGLYYSHVNWSDADYMTLTQNMTPQAFEAAKKVKYNYQKEWELKNKEGYYTQKKFSASDKITWDRFIARHDKQIGELVDNYNIDLLWLDFMYPNTGEFKWDEKQLREKLARKHPALIVNGRIGNYGDYATPEKGIPIIAPQGPWELCETLNDNWSYVEADHNNKSVRQVLRMLVDCISMGGNLLLGIGPKADGSLDEVQKNCILKIGKWIAVHNEAVYNTKRGLLPGHFYGPTTLSQDNRTLYLYLYDDPKDEIQIKGIKNQHIKKIAIVGRPEVKLVPKYFSGASWAGLPPVLSISVPHKSLDKDVTVVKIEFNEPIDLYRGKGKDIVNN